MRSPYYRGPTNNPRLEKQMAEWTQRDYNRAYYAARRYNARRVFLPIIIGLLVAGIPILLVMAASGNWG